MYDESRIYEHDKLNRYRKDGSFIGLKDLKAVDEAAGKWGGKDLETTLLRIRNEPDEADAKMRIEDMYQRYGYPEQGEYDALRDLHARICKAKGAMMDFDAYDDIVTKVKIGVIAQDRADRMIADAERKACVEASRKALHAFMQMNELVTILNKNQDVMLSDDEKAEAVERWQKRNAFEEAKKQMDAEALDLSKHGGILAAIQLREQFPEFQ